MTDTTDEFIPDIFSARGGIKDISEFDPALLKQMLPERKKLFDSAYAAAQECKQIEADAAQDTSDVYQQSRLIAGLRKQVDILRPARTFMDIYNASLGRPTKGIELTPEQTAEAEAIQAALNQAEADLIVMQSKKLAAHRAIPEARAILANAWERYHSHFPVQSGVEAAKAIITRNAERKRNGTDRPAPRGQRQSPSLLDSHLAAGRMPSGTRSSRQSQRGAFPAEARGQIVTPPALPPWATKPKGAGK